MQTLAQIDHRDFGARCSRNLIGPPGHFKSHDNPTQIGARRISCAARSQCTASDHSTQRLMHSCWPTRKSRYVASTRRAKKFVIRERKGLHAGRNWPTDRPRRSENKRQHVEIRRTPCSGSLATCQIKSWLVHITDPRLSRISNQPRHRKSLAFGTLRAASCSPSHQFQRSNRLRNISRREFVEKIGPTLNHLAALFKKRCAIVTIA